MATKEELMTHFNKYADDDTSLNEWIEDLMQDMRWELFREQAKWLYMSGELGEGRFPQIKDNYLEQFRYAFMDSVSILVEWMFTKLLMEYRLGNIDLGPEAEYTLKWELGDEEYEKWEQEAKEYIFNDYAENIGIDAASRIFSEAWGPEWDKSNSED